MKIRPPSDRRKRALPRPKRNRITRDEKLVKMGIGLRMGEMRIEGNIQMGYNRKANIKYSSTCVRDRPKGGDRADTTLTIAGIGLGLLISFFGQLGTPFLRHFLRKYLSRYENLLHVRSVIVDVSLVSYDTVLFRRDIRSAYLRIYRK